MKAVTVETARLSNFSSSRRCLLLPLPLLERRTWLVPEWGPSGRTSAFWQRRRRICTKCTQTATTATSLARKISPLVRSQLWGQCLLAASLDAPSPKLTQVKINLKPSTCPAILFCPWIPFITFLWTDFKDILIFWSKWKRKSQALTNSAIFSLVSRRGWSLTSGQTNVWSTFPPSHYPPLCSTIHRSSTFSFLQSFYLLLLFICMLHPCNGLCILALAGYFLCCNFRTESVYIWVFGFGWIVHLLELEYHALSKSWVCQKQGGASVLCQLFFGL